MVGRALGLENGCKVGCEDGCEVGCLLGRDVGCLRMSKWQELVLAVL